MRIAVTTFFQSQTNYGQLLQAYALQQVLMQMGHYPFIIRYGFHEPLRPVLGIEYPQVSMDKLQCNTHIEAKTGDKDDRHFNDFRYHHLNLSANAYNTLEEIQCHPPIADCYMTGSDQVWAQLLNRPDNGTFYLDFGYDDTLRVAYAPSFSLDAYPKEINSLLQSNLKRFDALSVREKTGVEICRNVGYEAKWVLDPTMLLDGDYYRQLAKESQSPLPSNYMLIYHVNIKRGDLPCWDAVNSYNKAYNLKAVAVHANGEDQPDVEFIDEADYCYPCIQDWIRLIDNSQYVLTSSFHGMVFSVLLHKPFLISLRPDSMFAGNDRVFTILSALGLEERLATSEVDVAHVLSKPIDWKEVDYRIDLLRKESYDYLKGSLILKSNKVNAQERETWIIRNTLLQTNKLLVQNNNLQEELKLSSELKQQLMDLSELKQQLMDMHCKFEAMKQEAERMSRKNKKHLMQIRLMGVVFAIILLSFVIFALI